MQHSEHQFLRAELDQLVRSGQQLIKRQHRQWAMRQAMHYLSAATLVAPFIALWLVYHQQLSALWFGAALTSVFVIAWLGMVTYWCWRFEVSRQQALGIFDTTLSDHNRLVIADEFLTRPSTTALHELAIQDAQPFISSAKAALQNGAITLNSLSVSPLKWARVMPLAAVITVMVIVFFAPQGFDGRISDEELVMTHEADEAGLTEQPPSIQAQRNDNPDVQPASLRSNTATPQSTSSQVGTEPEQDAAVSPTNGGAGARQAQSTAQSPRAASASPSSERGSATPASDNQSAQTASTQGTSIGQEDAQQTRVSEQQGKAFAKQPNAERASGEGNKTQQDGQSRVQMQNGATSPAATSAQRSQPANSQQPQAGNNKSGGKKQSQGSKNQSGNQSQGQGRPGNSGNKGRGNGDALKKTRGVAGMLLAVPMKDRFIGTLSPGAETTRLQDAEGHTETAPIAQAYIADTLPEPTTAPALRDLSYADKHFLSRFFTQQTGDVKSANTNNQDQGNAYGIQ